VATRIRLLGEPAIIHDGEEATGPRGRKAWALLAYLLLSEQRPTRRLLAELLFADASDPLGTLRWNLAQLRRALAGAAEIEGDPVKITLADGVETDLGGDAAAGGELLGTMAFDGSPAFESWLLVERGRFAGQAATALHNGALAALAAGNADEAAELAARLVALDPFEETYHELLVRSLVARGDRAGAHAQVASCRRLFMQELGVEPSEALRRAADVAPSSRNGDGVRTGDRGAARAHLQAGEAAIAAGAVEHGLTNLRQACDAAAASGDDELRARALLALGAALIHAVRGRDEEGAAVLTEALAVAETIGDRATMVLALRDLAFADLLMGRRAGVEQRLSRADKLAAADAERSLVLAARGMNCLDMGDYPGAFAALEEARACARRVGDERRATWCDVFIARGRLARGEIAEATALLDGALDFIESEQWLLFLPVAQAWRGEIDLIDGDIDTAGERFDHAFTLAAQNGDPCWEALSARNLALLHHARGDEELSHHWMDEARTRVTRMPDRYVWMQGHVIDTSIGVALDSGENEQALRLIRLLKALSSRAEMRELSVRALLHAERMGEAGALESARLLAADIDNPSLHELLARRS
jgi:DNA-binding SARP family transcriptional activator